MRIIFPLDFTPYVGFRNSTKAFIFSLSNSEGLKPFKVMVRNPSHAIYTAPDYGPTFGQGHDIYIASNANSNANSYTKLGVGYFVPDGVRNKNTILGGNFRIALDEVEVFYLI